jgi:hypothetical protein
MEDVIVDAGVYLRYCNKIMHFLAWINANKASWFTDYRQAEYNNLLVLQEDEKTNACQKPMKEAWMERLGNAKQTPIVSRHIQ